MRLLLYRFFWFFFLSFCLLQIGFSQTWPYFKRILKEDGMASNTVNCMIQDRNGFMWFGTDEGLTRFDGTNFMVFTNDPKDPTSIISNTVTSLCEDTATGNIWVGTADGLNLFKISDYKFYQNFNVVPVGKELLDNRILSIIIDSKKRLWLGTYHGLFMYTDINKAPILYKKPQKPYTDYCVFEDSKHNIWKGTETGAELLNTRTNQFVPLDGINCRVRSIFEDSRHNLWFATETSGAYVYKNGILVNYSKANNKLPSDKIFSIAEDIQGNIILAARDGEGLYYLNQTTDKVKVFSPDIYNLNSISGRALTSVYKDRFGNIWIGTYSSGLNLIDKYYKPFNHIKLNYRPDGLLNNNVRSFFQDSKGDIWVGTKEEGYLSKFDPATGTFKHYVNELLKDKKKYVLSIGEATPDLLIIGTLNYGLILFNKQNNQSIQLLPNKNDSTSLNNPNVYNIFKDRFGEIWVSTSNDIQKLNLQTKKFSTLKGLRSIKCCLDYSDDEIYFGGRFGLYCYNRRSQTYKVFNNVGNDSIKPLWVFGMVRDRSGDIWIASGRGGLSKFDVVTKKFTTYEPDGMPAIIGRSVEIDKHGNLWISTTNGLSKFNPVTKKFRNYNLSDGIQGKDFERSVSLKTTDGHMLFGGVNGFNYFFPDSIIDNPIVPKVVITDVKILNKPVSVNPEGPLKEHITSARELKLTYKQTTVSFDFIAINYSSPDNNRYAYMLEGFDDDWNYIVGNIRNANYTNLPPGNYVFKVKASNNDGIWNEEGTSIAVTVLPPWWNTWWFKLITALLLLTSTLAYVRYRTSKLRREKQRLELMVQDRTQSIKLQAEQLSELNRKLELNSEQRARFFTNISHEFRTPLSLIIAPLDKLLSMLKSNDETSGYLQIVKQNAVRLLNLVNELMDFRIAETQNVTLHLNQSNIVEFVNGIAGCFNELAKQRKMEYVFEARNNSFTTCFDPVILEKIIYNLISNAFKYTPEQGRIEISVGQWENSLSSTETIIGEPLDGCGYVEIVVKDNAIGISEENLPQIFTEFYREEPSKVVGTGIGLALTRELVKLHKGFLTVQSLKGHGSQFSVKFPVEKKCYGVHQLESDTSFSLTFSKVQVENILNNLQPDEQVATEQGVINTGRKDAPLLLIVEDNAELRKFIVNELSSTYQITEAEDGEEGFTQAMDCAPDLVISDVMMPKVSGIELCAKLKSEIQTSHIPVILLTALSEPAHQITGFESGADDYVPKPFNMDVLQARVQNLIQSRNKLKQVFSSITYAAPKEITSNAKDEKFLQKAMDIVYANYSDPDFGAKDLVDKMCVSTSLLHKKLVSLTNQSAIDFINIIRLKESIKLMADPDLSILDIASRVGFNDSKYYSKYFKKVFGKTPNEYRRNK